MCDRLLDSINSLRLAWSSSSDAYDVHRRTYPLLVTLKGCNNGQGLGCMPLILAAVFCLVILLISLVVHAVVVFGKVIVKKTLNLVLVSVGSMLGGIMPLIFLLTSEVTQPTGEEACTLSDVEVQRIKASMDPYNTSCSFNISLGAVLAS